jgi:hypothetical protein
MGRDGTEHNVMEGNGMRRSDTKCCEMEWNKRQSKVMQNNAMQCNDGEQNQVKGNEKRRNEMT